MENLEELMDSTTVKLVTDRLSSLHEDVNELKDSMRESMKEMSSAVTKLVLLEERNTQTIKLIDRISKELDEQKTDIKELRKEVQELEKQAPTNALTTSWVSAALYGIVGIAAMFVAKQVGFI